MLLKVESDLKEAILNLPEKEKEKLLIRLIRKDKVLINQLHFQLLEDENDLEDRKEKAMELINSAFQKIKIDKNKNRYYSRQLLIDLRAISGIINKHSQITKDKIGEVELRLYILSETFNYASDFIHQKLYDNEKLLKYLASRIKNVFTSYNKLHEDLQYDYQEKINKVLKYGFSSALKDYLKDLQIPKEI